MAKSSKFTLVLVAIAVVALGRFAMLKVQQHKAAAEAGKAQQHLAQIADALQQYKLHNYHYPTVEQGLKALVSAPAEARAWRGPYLENLQTTDLWGHEIAYKTTDYYGFELTSAGPDGVAGTPDDISQHN